MLVQPFVGFFHHYRFVKTQKQGVWTLAHMWYGRVLILLGIINGGLGLRLANNSRTGEIAYGVLGGLVGLVILLWAAFFEAQKRRQGKHQPEEVHLDERQKNVTA